MFILALIGLAFIFGAIIAKAIADFPYIQYIPVINELVAWAAGAAGYILPAGVAIFVFTSTRSVIYSLIAFFISLAATILVFKW